MEIKENNWFWASMECSVRKHHATYYKYDRESLAYRRITFAGYYLERRVLDIIAYKAWQNKTK